MRINEAGHEFGTREQLLADLAVWEQCDLGRWMLLNGGWDATWTRYCITYDRSAADPDTNEVEHFFLTQAPAIAATRQRAGIFRSLLSEMVSPGTTAMSVPCGLMDDLLTLPQTGDLLVGVDLDPAAVAGATANAADQWISAHCVFAVGDAWNLADAQVASGSAHAYRTAVAGGVDVLASNGLNIYVPSDARVVELYRSFRRALRIDGTLIVSALTPPGQWAASDLPRDVSMRARGLMLINDVMWSNYRPVEVTIAQLHAAGLQVRDVLFDDRRIFPTFVATAV